MIHLKQTLLAAMIMVAMGTAYAGQNSLDVPVPAAKVDNGLGSLPHFSTWTDTWVYLQPAESIDDGLGSLGHFSTWTQTWVYAYPAEKIDNGLGELTRRPPAPERAVAHAR